jgi:hypothetical protein
MMNFIKRFDAFPSASDDFRKKTTSGAIGRSSCEPFIHVSADDA